MKESNNNTLIIISSGDTESIKLFDSKTQDVLALTLSAISLLDGIGIKYYTLDDFINRNDAYLDTIQFKEAFSQWLIACDKHIEKDVDIDRIFSAEAFWFLIRFSGLRYIVRVVDEIRSRYNEVELLVTSEVTDLPKAEINWQTLKLFKFGYGLNSVLSFIYAGLPNVKYRLYQTKGITNKHRHRISKFQSVFFRTPDILLRRSKEALLAFFSSFTHKETSVWVVQGGYDVDVLKQSCSKTRFQYIRKREEGFANKSESIDTLKVRSQIKNITHDFLHEWLSYYNEWVLEWVLSYFDNIVMTYPSVLQGIRERMDKDRPMAVLYSIGSEDALEEAIAKVSIEKNIPVYYFKHSGADNLFVEPSVFDEYMEKNKHIKRTQFLSSAIEKQYYADAPNVNCIVVGALSRPKSIKKNITKNILYSVGPPTHHAYKEMGRIISDRERHLFAKNLLKITTKYHLSIDIKVHPAESNVGYDFASQLLSQVDCHNARVLPEGSIERILKNYGMIVLDMISTRVLTGVLNLDIPVVLYVPEEFPVNNDTFKDLRKRIYVVRNDSELEVVLKKFSTTGLPGLYCETFSNKYLGTSSETIAISKVRTQVCE